MFYPMSRCYSPFFLIAPPIVGVAKRDRGRWWSFNFCSYATEVSNCASACICASCVRTVTEYVSHPGRRRRRRRFPKELRSIAALPSPGAHALCTLPGGRNKSQQQKRGRSVEENGERRLDSRQSRNLAPADHFLKWTPRTYAVHDGFEPTTSAMTESTSKAKEVGVNANGISIRCCLGRYWHCARRNEQVGDRFILSFFLCAMKAVNWPSFVLGHIWGLRMSILREQSSSLDFAVDVIRWVDQNKRIWALVLYAYVILVCCVWFWGQYSAQILLIYFTIHFKRGILFISLA
jgi:hypothetical protein